MEGAASLIVALLFGMPALRLVRLAMRSGELPERYLAGFFVGFTVGIPLALYAFAMVGTPYHGWLRLTAFCCLLVAMTLLAIFARVVFRPESAHAKAYCIASAGVYAGLFTIQIATGSLFDALHWTVHGMTLWALGTLAWAFVECVIYYRRMSLQARLGLGDPVVRNRFLLWSVWTGAMVALPIMSTVVKAYIAAITPEGVQPTASPELLLFARLFVMTAGAAAAVSILLSFFAPDRYLAWLRSGSTARA